MNGSKKELRLSDFDISDKTGFLPPNPPLKRLPGEYISSWEEVCARIPDLIKSNQLRAEVDRLPERDFNEHMLKTEEEWRRAYVLVTFLSQAYIWAEGEAGVIERVPSKLAVPWCAVSEHVSLQPVLTYATVVHYNYMLRDNDKGMDEHNLKAISLYTGTKDESWFYMIHALVELEAAPGLTAIEDAYKAMDQEQNDRLAKDLEKIAQSIHAMRDTFLKMESGCDKKKFYVDVRPFLSGSEGIKAFPNGIIYEGVDTKPRSYRGGSAAQTTSIPSFDVFLGVKHTGSELEFLQTMREYQPRKHREFLETLDRQPSVRDYVSHSNDPKLVKSYNNAVQALVDFRSSHVILVTKYIVQQLEHSVNKSLESTGTGGTPFMEFLKKVRDKTVELKIKDI